MGRQGVGLVAAAVVVWGTAGAPSGGKLAQSTQKPAETGERHGAPAGAASSSQAAAGGDAARGKALYEKYGCWACHGYAGQGGAGPRLAPNPIPLQIFTGLVRHPPNQMPPYTEKVVSDAELADIHAYLVTIPAPPSVSTIPLLQDKE